MNYEVIADRDKGDDPTWADVSKGDRYFAESRHEYDWDLDRIVRIERPVPLPPSPHPPTREQIADELIERLNPHISNALSEDQLDAIAYVVRGMMRPAEEASTVRSSYHCMSEDAHTAHIWAGSWCPGIETPALIQNGADR